MRRGIIIAVILLLLGCWIFNMTCGGGEEVDTSAVTEYVTRYAPLSMPPPAWDSSGTL